MKHRLYRLNMKRFVSLWEFQNDLFFLNFGIVCMYAKREEYFLLEWIQWCQDIEYLENVFNIDACLLLLRMRKDVYQGSSQKGKIP